MRIRILFFLIFFVPQIADARFSLTPRPLSEAKIFLITEAGYYYKITIPPEGLHRREKFVSSDLGVMFNFDRHYALGTTCFALARDGRFRVGLQARGRRWLNPKSSMDVALGIVLYDSDVSYKGPALIGEIKVNYKDLFMLSVLLDSSPFSTVVFDEPQPGLDETQTFREVMGNEFGLSIGLKTGAIPGLVANGIGIIAAVIAQHVFRNW